MWLKATADPSTRKPRDCVAFVAQDDTSTHMQKLRAGFFLDLGPGVFEWEGAVEDQLAGFGVLVAAEVAEALKLDFVAGGGGGEGGLELGVG